MKVRFKKPLIPNPTIMKNILLVVLFLSPVFSSCGDVTTEDAARLFMLADQANSLIYPVEKIPLDAYRKITDPFDWETIAITPLPDEKTGQVLVVIEANYGDCAAVRNLGSRMQDLPNLNLKAIF